MSASLPMESMSEESEQKPLVNTGPHTPYINLTSSSYINPPSLLSAQVSWVSVALDNQYFCFLLYLMSKIFKNNQKDTRNDPLFALLNF